MTEAARQPGEILEVVALRKRIRGEPLTPEEERVLASVSRRPAGPGVPLSQEQLRALLEERTRNGE